MPKEGDWISCPNKECNGHAEWVCLGEPEGDFYSCDRCDGCFDENFKEIEDEEEDISEDGIGNHLQDYVR